MAPLVNWGNLKLRELETAEIPKTKRLPRRRPVVRSPPELMLIPI